MSEEITVIPKSDLRKMILEVLEEFFEQNDRLNKPGLDIPVPVNEKLISLKDVQKVVGCSAPKLFMLRKVKRFPPEIKIGNSVFFDRQKFIEFLDNGGTKAGIIS
jgi:predicted DNA-binding transcriptional regulator AlpA